MARLRTATPRKADWSPTRDHTAVTPAQIVRDRREQLGMGQSELAFKLGYTNPNFISMLETGHSFVPLDKAPAIAEVLRSSTAWFVERIMAQRPDDFANIHAWMFGPKGVLRELWVEGVTEAKKGVYLDAPGASAAKKA